VLAALALAMHTVRPYSTCLTVMDSQEWIARAAARLHEQWPRLPEDQLREVAAEIQRELEQPEHAAELWLRQGMPDPK
jgi:hypothetical protein